MKIETNRAALSAALETCLSATDGKSTIGLLSCVHLVVKGGKLTVNATDLNITAVVDVEIASPSVAGAVTVNAKDLRDVVKQAPGAVVHLALDTGGSGTALVVKAGKFSRRMPTVGDSYPKVAECPAELQTMSGGALVEVLKMCAPVVSKDESKFHMAGVILRATGTVIRGSATDGHRVHIAERSAEVSWDGLAIVPQKAVRAIVRLVDGADIEIGRTGELLHVRCGSARLSMKLIDAVPPVCENVVPSHKAAAEFDRAGLHDAVGRTRLESSTEIPRALSMQFGGGDVGLRCVDPDGRLAEDSIEATGTVKKGTVGVNAAYLVESLAALGGERVVMRVGNPNNDGKVVDMIMLHRAGEEASKASGDLCVIAPMSVA